MLAKISVIFLKNIYQFRFFCFTFQPSLWVMLFNIRVNFIFDGSVYGSIHILRLGRWVVLCRGVYRFRDVPALQRVLHISDIYSQRASKLFGVCFSIVMISNICYMLSFLFAYPEKRYEVLNKLLLIKMIASLIETVKGKEQKNWVKTLPTDVI